MNAKKLIKRIIVAIILLALVSMAAVSTSIARYQNVYTGSSGTLDVAKWDVSISGKSNLTTISGSNVMVTPTVNQNASNHNVSDGKIAPGTKGELAQIKITNNSEVVAYYELVIKITNYAEKEVDMPRQLKIDAAVSGTAVDTATTMMTGNNTGADSTAADRQAKTITFRGTIPQAKDITCKATWEWLWSNTFDSNDTAAGNNAARYTDSVYTVSIEKFNVVQHKPGA